MAEEKTTPLGMSLAHVKEALPKLVRQCPEGEIRQLLQLAEERLHGLERTGPVVRVSKADLLLAFPFETIGRRPARP